MTDTRQTAQRYMELLCAQKFPDAFEMIDEHGTYTIIGSTPLSRTFEGRAAVKAALVPALASFREPPRLTLHEIIVEGTRAVALASGEGVGPTGKAYSQPHYAMVLSVRDGRIQSVVEFMDTVAVETALVGNKLVPA